MNNHNDTTKTGISTSVLGMALRRLTAAGIGLYVAMTFQCAAQSQVLYDSFSESATFQVVALPPQGETALWLAVTFEEGLTRFPAGSTMRLHLRSRAGVVELATDRPVGPNDITTRRFTWQPDLRYVTCYYPLTDANLNRLLTHDIYRVEVETSRGTLLRTPATRSSQRFARALEALTQSSH